MFNCVRRAEFAIASLTLIDVGPVLRLVHMLIAGVGREELPRASLALGHDGRGRVATRVRDEVDDWRGNRSHVTNDEKARYCEPLR